MSKSDKLIVLDLDETLFHCDIFLLDNHNYSFIIDKVLYSVIKRPYVDEFLSYIKDNFEYGVYTAASKDYAEKHLEALELDPKFLLHNDNCTIKFDHKMCDQYLLKRLSKVKKYSPLSKIIAIDDKYESYKENYGNLIKVKPFFYDHRDNILLKLIDHLEILKEVEDVRKVDKRGWYT